MRTSRRSHAIDPHALGVAAPSETGGCRLVAITLGAAIAGAAMFALGAGRAATAGGARLLVVTSEPVDPRAILRVATASDADLALDSLGVVVVAPEGFGALEAADRELSRRRARKAEEVTVAGLRRAGITAAGHVGDHDPVRAVDHALSLFQADRTLVFAGPRLAEAYRRRLSGRGVEVIELPDEPPASGYHPGRSPRSLPLADDGTPAVGQD
jgi:hypothetical protein